MILRRFSKHVTDQNWFAVWLDIVVVVVGIFLGMQVTEWNERRKEAIQEDEFLHRFVVDIEKHIGLMKAKMDRLKVIYEEELYILNYLQSNISEKHSNGRLITAIYNSTSVFPYYVYNVTYDELLNSGKFNIIDSVKKRDAISIFYKDASRLDEIWNIDIENQYRLAVRAIIEPEIQKVILDKCEIRNKKEIEIQKNCEIEYDETELLRMIDSFSKIENIENLLRLNLTRTNIAINALNHNTEESKDLLEVLTN